MNMSINPLAEESTVSLSPDIEGYVKKLVLILRVETKKPEIEKHLKKYVRRLIMQIRSEKIQDEAYRITANRGALLFFLMNDLYRIHTFYKYSLSAFLVVVARAIDMIEEGRLHFDNLPG